MSRMEQSLTEYDLALIRSDIERKAEPIPECGCWLWTGNEDKDGYGVLWVRAAKCCGKAHRLSYRAFAGVDPGKAHVLHKCDTPLCVNPDHLYLGTAQINLSDMSRKRRGVVSRAGLPFGVRKQHCVRRRSNTPHRYEALITHRQKEYYLGAFATAEEAGTVARAKKDQLLREDVT